jgi:hypothetical protein
VKLRTAPEGTAQQDTESVPLPGGQRAWTREVSWLDDDELIAVVRNMVLVDRAVRRFRDRKAA